MVPITKNKISIFNFIFCVLMTSMVIIMLICLPNVREPYGCVILLPAIYLLCYILCINVMNSSGYDIKLIILFMFFIKLYILPAFVIFSGKIDLSAYNSEITDNVLNAVVIQIIEMISVTIGLIVFTPKQCKEDCERFHILKDRVANRYVRKVIIACVVVIILALVIYPAFLLQFRPLFFVSEEQELAWKRTSETAWSTITPYVYYPLNWLLAVTRIAFAYLMTTFIWKKRALRSSNLSLFLTAIVIALVLLVFVPDDVAASIIAAVCLMLLVTKLYADKRKLIYRTVLLLCAALFAYMFIISPFLSSDSMKDGLSDFITKINAYFSGFLNVSGAVEMESQDKASYFLGDFLRSFPIFKGFFTHMPRSTELFNIVLGYDRVYFSQIIPLEGQSYFYFGYLGVLIIPLLTVKCCMRFYEKMVLSKETYGYFIYCFYTLLLAFGIVMYDVFLILFLALSYLPLLCILVLVKKKGKSYEDINISG